MYHSCISGLSKPAQSGITAVDAFDYFASDNPTGSVFLTASRKKQTRPLKGHFHIGHGSGVEALGNHAILHRDRPGQILSDEQFLSVRYPTPKTARPHIGEALCRICLDMTVR